MRGSPFRALLLGAFITSGCVTFKEGELAEFRSHQVSPATYRKLTERVVLSLDDIVELSARRVPDALIVKQLDKVGVDYALRKRDVALIERAGVSPAVMEALIAACERWVNRFAPPEFFETHNFDSGEYAVVPSLRSSRTLLEQAETDRLR